MVRLPWLSITESARGAPSPISLPLPTAWRERWATRRLVAALLALGLAIWGQHILLTEGTRRDGLILFVAAGFLFALSAPALPRWPTLPGRRAWPRWGQILTGVSLALALVATGLFWSDEHSTPGLWLWLLAILLYIPGTRAEDRLRQPSRATTRGRVRRLLRWLSAHRWELLWLTGILLLAAAARFHRLDMVPNGCQSDECNNGLDALRWLRGAPYTVYAGTNEGQATFFTYLLALSFKLFGPGVVQMRAVSALIGVLTVLAFYLLARDLFGPNVALIAAGFLAGSRWHITFSRIIYELILVPLFEALLLYFLLRALRHGRRRDWALAGLLLGGGMHTYTAWRVIPLAIGVFLLYWLATHRSRWRRDVEGIALLAGGAYIALVPLGVYIIRHWGAFLSRIRHISVFNDVARVGSYEPVWSNLRKTLWMFNYQGDFAALNNLPGAPLLPFDAQSPQALMSHVPGSWLLASLVGALFILGVAYALRYLSHPLPFLLISSFLIIGSVAVLSVAHEAPTARRPIGLIPLIFLLVALVLNRLEALYHWALRGHGREWVHMAMALAVMGVYLGGVDTYFNVQARNESVYIAYSGIEAAVGRYIRTLPPDARIYLVPAFQHHSAVKFIGGRPDTRLLNLVRDLPLREDPGGDVVYILEAVDARLEPLFRQFYPTGELEEHRDPFGRLYFISFRVPRAQVNAVRGLAATYFEGDQGEAGPIALQRRDGPLDLDFSTAPPAPPPFSAHWEGTLLVPGFGPYRFEAEIDAGAALTLTVGNQVVVDTTQGTTAGEVTLVAGLHGLEMNYRSGPQPRRLTVYWSGPGVERQPIPREALYSIPAPRNGLIGYYYPTIDWSGPPALIEKDLLVLPNNALGERFSILWRGKIAAPRAGPYIFGTRSDDGSYVYIDGQLVVDNGGHHGAEYREGRIDLSQGFHDIEVRYFQDGGSREMQLWWMPPGGPRELIPPEYLFPLEGEELPADLVLPPPPEAAPPARPTIPEEAEPAPQPPGAGLPPAPTIASEQLWSVGSCGDGAEQLSQPRGLAVDGSGRVFVADAGNHRVVRLSPTGDPELAFGGMGDGSGQFLEPFDVVIEADGSVVVLDATAQRLQRFTPEGEFLASFGGDLAMYRPRGLGIDATGDLYVADTGGLRLLRLSRDGALLQQWGGRGAEIGAGQPVDAAVGPDGTIYLVEAETGLLWRLSPDGSSTSWTAIMPASTIDGPHVAVGPDGLIYVTDPELWRVVVYEPGGRPVAQFGEYGIEPGQFLKPVGLAVGSDGRIYVSDSQACRVQAFAPLEVDSGQ
ncbi:MAG: hypothetical protein GXP39_00715 [Chloroflexi bacterium]|nr:hypothetical protein [Chloroflexota bacterium]